MRLATMSDLQAIDTLVEEAKMLMQQDNNPQWDARYPVLQDFEKDIQERTLFVLDEQQIIKGFIVINDEAPDWYDQLEWPIDRGNAFVIHRLVASSQYPGTAKQLMHFATSYAEQHQKTVLLTDTFSENQRAQSLFKKHHFIKSGEMTSNLFPFDKGKPFYAYYKKLTR
ncbi:N-acetyltransferase [Staphylococcus muscae]|uniref:GNAT family acetyltransferase n=1 Tax=Staphylococcus muscae TaxID=1294 RepID=A0A240C3M7_9STAP|nr:GNAT family N-acetyltransferase [Staphylococcus muscae]AVQ33186.1 N-acetyltransferase [Staphylococcus muscae]PNZ02775.1 N-acetyltransferase [Staphylococcus muscae]GGA93766.1 N-acetyltransferase [Staphylococcus muscae]SNW02721.1 GNAT family acetyltransferase [Staphylococcus muscae]